jgi:hypothetical protein
MTIVFELPYCNVYGTGYQLRYVYRNNGSGIAVEYITGTLNLYQIWGRPHALGPVGQRKKGSTGHSNTHFSKCVKLELTIRQSFAKPRRIWGSNYARKGKNQSVWNMEDEGGFYRGGEGSSPRGCTGP